MYYHLIFLNSRRFDFSFFQTSDLHSLEMDPTKSKLPRQGMISVDYKPECGLWFLTLQLPTCNILVCPIRIHKLWWYYEYLPPVLQLLSVLVLFSKDRLCINFIRALTSFYSQFQCIFFKNSSYLILTYIFISLDFSLQHMVLPQRHLIHVLIG